MSTNFCGWNGKSLYNNRQEFIDTKLIDETNKVLDLKGWENKVQSDTKFANDLFNTKFDRLWNLNGDIAIPNELAFNKIDELKGNLEPITSDNTIKLSKLQIDKIKTVLYSKIRNIDDRLRTAEKEQNLSKIESLSKVKESTKDLVNQLNELHINSGLLSFIDNINNQVQYNVDRLSDKDISPDDIQFYKMVLEVKPTIDLITEHFQTTKSKDKNLIDKLKNINYNFGVITKNIINTQLEGVGEFLNLSNSNTNLTEENIKEQLLKGRGDVSPISRWLGLARNSKDSILALLAKSIQKSMFLGRKKALDINKEIADKTERLIVHRKSKGININNQSELYGFMLEKDDKGNLTGNFVQEKTKEFRDALNLWYSKNPNSKISPQEYKSLENKYKSDVIKKMDSIEKEYYDFVIKTKKEAASVIDSHINDYKIPTVKKSTAERITQNGVFSKDIWEDIKQSVTIDELDYNYKQRSKLNGDPINTIPIFFNSSLENFDINDLSLNVANSLMLFNRMAYENQELMKIQDKVEAVKEFLANRDVVLTKKGIPVINSFVRFLKEKVGKEKSEDIKDEEITVKGETTQTYQQASDFIDMIFYKKPSEGTFIGGKDISKALDKLNNYTAISKLAGNLFQAASSVITTSVWTNIEAVGGGVFNRENLNKARAMYFGGDPMVMNGLSMKNLPKYITDAYSNSPENLINLMREYFQIGKVDSEFQTKYLKALDMENSAVLNNAGEHMLSSIMMLSVMDNIKVKNSITNKEVSLYEIFEVQNKRLVIKQGFTFTSEDAFKVNRKVVALNEQLSGVLSNDDKVALKKFAIGRSLLLFRNWVLPAYNKRFRYQYDEEGNIKPIFNQATEQEEIGYYMLTGVVLKDLYKAYKQEGFSKAKEVYDNLSPQDRAKFHQFLVEQAYIMGFLVLAQAIKYVNPDDDDEKYTVLSIMNVTANRVNNELLQFDIPLKTLELLKSPAAGLTMFESLSNTIWSIVGFEINEDTGLDFNINNQYEKGSREGQYKVFKPLKELTPWGTIDRLNYINEEKGI